MPISINDRKLAALYTSLEKQKASNPNFKIGNEQVLQLLAEVGDRSGWSSSKLMNQLKQPGVTRDQAVAMVQKGMSKAEKADLAEILDKGDVPLDPSAKQFIESVLGRTGPNPPPPPPTGDGNLHVVGDQKTGIAGTAKAGDTIEAINLTTAPGGRLHVDDTMVIGKADNTGKFTGLKLPDMQEGDVIRMRARHADGSAGDWVTFNVHGEAAADTRNAVVAMFRVGLTANASGKIDVSNINEGRQISEPNAKLQFTNVRSGEKTVVTLDKDGTFAPNTQLNGKAGDVFSIAASDGKNNTNFATEVGRLTVPGGDGGTVDLIKDPALHKDELNPDGSPKFEKHRFTGPLFKGTPKPEEVQQGQLGDCYFPSAAAAMAKNHPEVIQNMMKDNGDGTYTITWKEKDWSTGKFKDVPVKVDGDLYVRSWGGPLYGATNGPDKGEKTMELWFPLLEKSYAQWKGSYNTIGNGGQSSDVFEAMMGRDADYMDIGPNDTDKAWKQITTKIDAKLPVSAGTYGDDQEAKYTNTGVYADHSYSVLGYEQSNGQKYVILRNPWGESEPAGNGPNDGIFKLDIKTFCNLYQSVMSVD